MSTTVPDALDHLAAWLARHRLGALRLELRPSGIYLHLHNPADEPIMAINATAGQAGAALMAALEWPEPTEADLAHRDRRSTLRRRDCLRWRLCVQAGGEDLVDCTGCTGLVVKAPR